MGELSTHYTTGHLLLPQNGCGGSQAEQIDQLDFGILNDTLATALY